MDKQGEFVASMLTAGSGAYAAGIVERQVQVQPDVFERYGSNGFEDLAGDTKQRIEDLAESVALGVPELFGGRIAWLKVALNARGVPLEFLRVNLECMRDELSSQLPEQAVGVAETVSHAVNVLASAPAEIPSFLAGDVPHADLARNYLLAILETRCRDAIEMILAGHERGLSVTELHFDVIGLVQAEVGRMWQMAEIHVAEEHLATAVSAQAMAQLRAIMPRSPLNGHRVICTTVGGDLHDLGLQMVSDHLEMAGWQSISLGASTPAVDLLHAARDFEADVFAISANLVTHLRSTAQLIRAIRAHGDPPTTPVLVGGQPFVHYPKLWEVVGADGSAVNAVEAVEVASRLVGG